MVLLLPYPNESDSTLRRSPSPPQPSKETRPSANPPPTRDTARDTPILTASILAPSTLAPASNTARSTGTYPATAILCLGLWRSSLILQMSKQRGTGSRARS
jgi:hypothetical protein